MSSDGLKMTINMSWQFHLNPAYVSEIHKSLGPEFDEIVVVLKQVRGRGIFLELPEDLYQTRDLKLKKKSNWQWRVVFHKHSRQRRVERSNGFIFQIC
jgi:hypothetical protein